MPILKFHLDTSHAKVNMIKGTKLDHIHLYRNMRGAYNKPD